IYAKLFGMRKAGIAMRILIDRNGPDPERQEYPKPHKDDRPECIPTLVEEGALSLENPVRSHRLGIRPVIEMMPTTPDSQGNDEHQDQADDQEERVGFPHPLKERMPARPGRDFGGDQKERHQR